MDWNLESANSKWFGIQTPEKFLKTPPLDPAGELPALPNVHLTSKIFVPSPHPM